MGSFIGNLAFLLHYREVLKMILVQYSECYTGYDTYMIQSLKYINASRHVL